MKDVPLTRNLKNILRVKFLTEQPKKMSELIKEQIANLEKNLKSLEAKQDQWLKTTLTPETHNHDAPKGHKTVEEVIECPTCKQKLLDKMRPELFKEFSTKIKSKEIVECLDCGEMVNVKETNCPTCKGTRAKYK